MQNKEPARTGPRYFLILGFFLSTMFKISSSLRFFSRMAASLNCSVVTGGIVSLQFSCDRLGKRLSVIFHRLLKLIIKYRLENIDYLDIDENNSQLGVRLFEYRVII